MTKKVFDQIMEGLNDALAYAKGDESRATLHVVNVPTIPVEMAAAIADQWARPSVLRLRAGEMTAQEMRTARAVARGIAAEIRRQAGPPDDRA